MPTTLHTLTGDPDEPDRPAPAASEPYWRNQTWRPARYRDNTGALADLIRRLATRLFRLRWRLSLDVIVHAYIHAADEQTACLTVTDALRHPDTVIALSRAEPDAVPPWRALGTADRVELYWDVDAVEAGTADDAWKCRTLLLLRFTVDVADTGWPDRDFVVDVIPAVTQPRLFDTETQSPVLIRRIPTRAPRRPRTGRTPPRDTG
jgi:hypothetical protein